MLDWEYLSDEHKEQIDEFRCSDEDGIECFLKERAFQLHHVNSAITRLFFDEDRNFVGYFTLHNDLVLVSSNQRTKHELTHMWRKDHLPAVKLHYLGVDERFRKRGFGRYLTLEALTIAKEISQMSGCNLLTVESLPSSYEFYLKHGFKHLTKGNNGLINVFFNLDEFDL